ncbi:hypothetical protein CFN78_28190 [Amycolatopsis antarctica]|uniref:Uncharacterized protein n=1 Tax=Amycolatopsis antarctica TaxID=1854586 RepID=A0A263CX36_9PSEU|nr:hypothetical protein [Amycolatopsis antarctica]OZM69906.1 hypothetical protein CFN78_28190 [Amycolatopsis antarctica]
MATGRELEKKMRERDGITRLDRVVSAVGYRAPEAFGSIALGGAGMAFDLALLTWAAALPVGYAVVMPVVTRIRDRRDAVANTRRLRERAAGADVEADEDQGDGTAEDVETGKGVRSA